MYILRYFGFYLLFVIKNIQQAVLFRQVQRNTIMTRDEKHCFTVMRGKRFITVKQLFHVLSKYPILKYLDLLRIITSLTASGRIQTGRSFESGKLHFNFKFDSSTKRNVIALRNGNIFFMFCDEPI